MTQSPLIETKNLTIRFGGHVAVDHVNLQILSYTFKSIIGPNGAGKTTFFNMISGQIFPFRREGFFQRPRYHSPLPSHPHKTWDRKVFPTDQCVSVFNRSGKCQAGCSI
jgi:ABC-type branched-subunit amino acid transport system ATPase component